MTRARDIANLVDANGDIVAGALDNVPAADLVNDTTPQLGGALDAQSNNITNVGILGVGETSPLGKLHIKSADSGASANAHADELVIENDANAGLSILSGNDDTGFIYFGDDGDDNVGEISYNHDGNKMSFGVNADHRFHLLAGGGRDWYSNINEARWFITSSNFNNPTITLLTGTVGGGNYPQTCFEVEMFGNGVSANEHQVFRGGGTFDYNGSNVAQNLTTYTTYHKGNALPAVPYFSLSGNSLNFTCNRQTNYDTYRISVRAWGRSYTLAWGSHN